MKICIVTIIDYQNYGNRLQNYAIKKLFEIEKWDTLSGLQVYSKQDWEESSPNFFIKVIKHLTPFFVFSIRERKKVYSYYINSSKSKRIARFKAFTKKNIPTLPIFVVKNKDHLIRRLERYSFDYFVAGSDQIWNPNFAGEDFYFLTFAPIKKRLSFAASFGVNSIPEIKKNRYSLLLNQMQYISVRELEGYRIISELTGRNDINISLDPTLLLRRVNWENLILDCAIEKPSHYIATYFIGKTPDAVYTFAKKEGLSLMEMNSRNMPNLFNIDPIEFLSIIRDADYVLTDSFHGMAFSIIFNKEFYVFRRFGDKHADMFSRLEGLLSVLGIHDRVQKNDEVKIVPRISKDNWDKIDAILENHRNESMISLKAAMERSLV